MYSNIQFIINYQFLNIFSTYSIRKKPTKNILFLLRVEGMILKTDLKIVNLLNIDTGLE